MKVFQLKSKETPGQEWLFRVIIGLFGRDNIYRFQARQTTSLGAVMVATVAKAWCLGFDAEAIDENNYRVGRPPRDKDGLPNHLALQKERYASIVGISCSLSNSAPRCLDIIRQYKAMPEQLRPKAIIAGGWHARDNAQEFLDAGADVVVHGEAEPILPDLLEVLKEKISLENIPGISYWSENQIKRNGPEEILVEQDMMDSLPHPDFNLLRYVKIEMYPVGRTRGCDGKCRFCRVKCEPRSISPERFLEQLVVLVSKDVRKFFVVDDRSEQDLNGFIYWLEKITNFQVDRKIKLDFTAQCRLSLAKRPDVLAIMRKAGIKMVAIGYESPIPEELAAMKKPVNPSEMLEWTKVWQQFDFFIHMMLIFGYPIPPEHSARLREKGKEFIMSAKQRSQAFWKFITQARPDTLQILLLTPIPGTEDWDFLNQENRIYKEFGWELYEGMWLLFKPDEGVDPLELQLEMIKLHQKFYSFPYVWKSSITSLLAHLLKIGTVTISLPFVWPILGYTPWQRVWRNSKRRFQAHLIIMAYLKSFKRLDFTKKLVEVARKY